MTKKNSPKKITHILISAVLAAAMLLTAALPAPSDAAPAKAWKAPKGTKNAALSICRTPDGAVFDLTTLAGQKLYRYDTLQGACADKGFGYFTQYNRINDYTKIVKVRLRDMKVVKVSRPLAIKHANEITFNSRKNIIVVANSTPKPRRLSIVDPKTLKVKYHKTIRLTRRVKGMPRKEYDNFRGVGAIAYNAKHNCYICYTRTYHHLLFLDAKFRPYRMVRQNAMNDMLFQGLDSYRDCIFVCQSFSDGYNYNAVTVYNMKGRRIARYKIRTGFPVKELETLFHDGNQFYAGFYSFFGSRDDEKRLHVQRKNYIYRITNL